MMEWIECAVNLAMGTCYGHFAMGTEHVIACGQRIRGPVVPGRVCSFMILLLPLIVFVIVLLVSSIEFVGILTSFILIIIEVPLV